MPTDLELWEYEMYLEFIAQVLLWSDHRTEKRWNLAASNT